MGWLGTLSSGSQLHRINSFGEFVSAWDFSSTSAVLLLLMASAYIVGSIRLSLRISAAGAANSDSRFWARFGSGMAGFALLAFALAGPLDVFAGDLFTAHSAQHIIIAMLAAPLLLIARPMPSYIWAFPRPMRSGAGTALTEAAIIIRALRFFTHPMVALPLFLLSQYVWHIPAAYNGSLENEWVHLLMHFTMFTAAVFFWWPIVGPPPVRTRLSHPERLVFLLLAVTPVALLAAIITLSKSVLFDFYLDSPGHFNWSPLEDQRIGGLLMWIPGNFTFLFALTVLFFRWFTIEERKSSRAAADRPADKSSSQPGRAKPAAPRSEPSGNNPGNPDDSG